MTWFSGLLIYFILWWVVLFTVLPWGVRATLDVDPGNDPGAPQKHHLKIKFIITSLITAFLWLGIDYLMTIRFIRLDG